MANGNQPRPMYCLTCGYDLRNLPADRCPECGREFDPARRATFADKPGQARGFAFWIAVLIVTYPALPLALLVLTLIVATASLGHPPTPMVDDPKCINGLVSVLHALTTLGLMGTLVYLPVCLCCLMAYPIAGRGPNRAAKTAVLAMLAFVPLATLWLTMAGTRVGEWFLD